MTFAPGQCGCHRERRGYGEGGPNHGVGGEGVGWVEGVGGSGGGVVYQGGGGPHWGNPPGLPVDALQNSGALGLQQGARKSSIKNHTPINWLPDATKL